MHQAVSAGAPPIESYRFRGVGRKFTSPITRLHGQVQLQLPKSELQSCLHSEGRLLLLLPEPCIIAQCYFPISDCHDV
jgi:hypothetical protein